jgi:protein-L-isoaspartate(D-aspartate) O-methyltransferase
MILALQDAGIENDAVLRAMAAVPRHFFMDSIFARDAYKLQAMPLPASADNPDEFQTISHPYTVAWQTQLLQVEVDDKILEIGTGSGYQAAVLWAMGVRQLFSVERQQNLYSAAKKILSQMDCHPTLMLADGFEGLPQYAPFDKIIVTCGASNVPPNLKAQLAVNGRMVIPIKGASEHHLFVIVRISQNQFEATDYGKCRSFVPMLKNIC